MVGSSRDRRLRVDQTFYYCGSNNVGGSGMVVAERVIMSTEKKWHLYLRWGNVKQREQCESLRFGWMIHEPCSNVCDIDMHAACVICSSSVQIWRGHDI